MLKMKSEKWKRSGLEISHSGKGLELFMGSWKCIWLELSGAIWNYPELFGIAWGGMGF